MGVVARRRILAGGGTTLKAFPIKRPPEIDVQDLLRKFESLQTKRANWDSLWQEVAEVCWPDAADFTTRRTQGARRTDELYDATMAMALEKFGAVMESMLTPRAQKWHKLVATNEKLNDDSSVKEWMEEGQRVLFQLRNAPRAAFYSQKHEGYKSLGAFGNDCLFVGEAKEEPGLRYRHCHVSQIYIDVDEFGQVDTIFRRYPLSARAAKQSFGNRLSPKVEEAVAKNPYREFDFLHVVRPRADRDPGRPDFRSMKLESLHISLEDKMVVREGGYSEMPYMYSRFTVNPYEMHGRSPAMLVLPGGKMLQAMKRTHLRVGEKVADPPLLTHDDGVTGQGMEEVRTLISGEINYNAMTADGKPLIAPLITGGRLDISHEMMEAERAFINEAFYVTLFQILVDQPNMTATEALLRAQEKGQFLAPTVGRQQSEMLGPMIERELNSAIRQGLLPPLPGVLLEAQGEYEIVYESPATRFQRSEELVGIQRTIEIMLPFAQFDPGIMRIFKPEEIAQVAAEVNGAPSKTLRTVEEYLALRAKEERQAEVLQLLEAAQMGAGAAKDASAAGLPVAEAAEGGVTGVAA